MKTHIKIKGDTTIRITKDMRDRLLMFKLKAKAKNLTEALDMLMRYSK